VKRMDLDRVKRIAASVLKTGVQRVWFNPEEADRIREVMTKEDVRELVKEGIIRKRKPHSQSKARARRLREKKSKGRKLGQGKRKGRKKVRAQKKKSWVKRVRAQRAMLKELKRKNPKAVEKIGYGKLYRMVKGNYFKGKNYLKAYVEGRGAK
jgi:large subunit ribosomal protein L19e